jgi:hypothetical protein
MTSNRNDFAASIFAAARFRPGLSVTGNLTVFSGTKQGAVALDNGEHAALYAMESPESWFEDFGSARLTQGAATIEIEPLFAQTINTAVRYHVFLTPNGPCQLYVAKKDPTSFRVDGFAGAADCEFDYRIVAKRKGTENLRLERIAAPEPIE